MGHYSFLIFGTIFLGVAAFIVYSFSNWVLKKLKIGKDSGVKFIAIIPTIILTPITIVAVAFGIFLLIDTLQNSKNRTYRTFSEYSWKRYPSDRIEMVHDLIENKILKDKTRPEVTELLGDDYRRYDENTMIYNLKKNKWYFIKDPPILKIHFWSGRVVKTETNHKSNKTIVPDTEIINKTNIVTECEAVQYEHEEATVDIEVFTE